MFNWPAFKWTDIKSQFIYLIYGEYFTDALRNTLTILIPMGLLFFMEYTQAAIGVGIGALLISLTDGPGHRHHKWVTAVNSISIFFFSALLISYSLINPWLTALSLFVLTFLCAMLAIFGSRLALTGTMAIILGTFVIGLNPVDPFLFSIYVLVGGTWYYFISLIQTLLWPYRSLHQAIFECIEATARLLKAKAKCYDAQVPLDECYRETIAMHILVSEKQELMRTLLLGDRSAMKPDNPKGRRLLHIALHLIDLYEQATAIHYDYALVRRNLDEDRALKRIIGLIDMLAEELEMIGGSFLLPSRQSRPSQGMQRFELEKMALLEVAAHESKANASVLLKIIRNMESIAQHLTEIMVSHTLRSVQSGEKPEPMNYKAFLSPKMFTPGSLTQHFSFRSAPFRFAMRLAILCLFGYLITIWFHFGKYGYWLLLTIVIVARPRFGLTWKRNIQRLSGTLVGVLIGLVLVNTIHHQAILLFLSALFLLGFFTFNRIKYALSVMCITPMVIICLGIYSGNVNDIISDRIYYTIFGCMIAFAAAYLFPVWEASQLKSLIANVAEANFIYLEKVISGLWTKPQIAEVRLARKNSHLKLAKLSEGLQYTLLEPHMKKVDFSVVHAVQNLSYRVNAIIASLSLSQNQIADAESRDLTAQISLNLRHCIQHNVSLGQLSVHHVEVAEDENEARDLESTLKYQLRLLKNLTAELKSYFQ